MAGTTRSKAAEMLRSHKRAIHFLSALACAAVFVVIGVSLLLRQQGVAMAHEVTVLDCHYAGNAAHTHNADCYDEDGTLVCPLPERELHAHDSSCYTETRTLVCGLEEDENHTHTDECYEVTRTLTCGKEEVTEEHVHGPACFTTITVVDASSSAAAPDASSGAAAADAGTSDEQTLIADLRKRDKNGDEYVAMRVQVKAPSGALPDTPTLTLKDITGDAAQEADDQLKEAIHRELGDAATVTQVTFADIKLADAAGNDLTPDDTLEVKLTAPIVQDFDPKADERALVLVELPNSDLGTTEATLVKDVSLVNWDENDQTKGDEDTLLFHTDKQLVSYAIVEVDIPTTDDVAATSKEVAESAADETPATKETSEAATEAPAPEDPASTPDQNYEAAPFLESDLAVKLLQQTLTASDGRTYDISVTYAEDAQIPEGAELVVREVTEVDSNYAQVFGRARDAATAEYEEATVTNARFFDISLMKDGAHLEPLAPVEVNIVLASGINANEQTSILHFTGNNVEKLEADVAPIDQEVATSTAASEAEKGAGAEISFNTEKFSIFAVVEVHIEKDVLASDGHNYHITVTYGPDAGVPEDAELEVREILEEADAVDGTTEYEEYVAKTQEALGLDSGAFAFARFFDIKIVDGAGNKVTIEAPVDVTIELADKSASDAAAAQTQIVHFADGADAGDVIDSATADGNSVVFKAEGFSAYAIVEKNIDPTGFKTVKTLDELANAVAGETFAMSVKRSATGKQEYFTSTLNGYNALLVNTDNEEAAVWHFEKTGTTDNQYNIYTMVSGQKKYLVNPDSNNAGFSDTPSTTYELSEAGSGTFYIKIVDESKWLQYSGSGSGIRFYTDNKNQFNPKITLTYTSSFVIDEDPYGLDNTSYGLMNWNGGAAGKALMGEESGDALVAMSLTVMSTSNYQNHLFVPNDSEISMWTFEWIENDNYYLTTKEGGSTKYLKITNDGLSLVAEPDDSCKIQVIPGTGSHENQICLKSGNTTLTYSGDIDRGFIAGGSAGAEWLNFVEISPITDDYLRPYSASKIGVSDERLTNNSKVIVYARSWNETKKRYDFYAIGPDGTVVPVTESGDSIEWFGGQLNDLLWVFEEHYWEGTSEPNYYYDLYNEKSKQYLAPQVTDGQILASEPIGINLNGRRDGQYYTTILAWDDKNYSYAGLKIDENGQIVSCPKSEAMDFYFATMEDLNIDDDIHTVNTLDHTQYGITMKIIDLENDSTIDGDMNKFLGSKEGGAVTRTVPGLLSTDLGEDNYPTAARGSLAGLYSGAKEVNHLFIESTYYTSGYFEYNSTQNFASLTKTFEELQDGDSFTVYKELGTNDSSNKNTLKHGQFLPFNDLEAGNFATVNGQNLYTIYGNTQLPDSDPRKHESLYNVENNGKKTDYYYAVELEANFWQTPSGLDAWGHDIIFEFTGDDDFWLYVDDELVIDLGGIHSALPGSVNFRTGQVNVNGKQTRLRDLFINNYKDRGHTQEEAEAHVSDKFTQNDDGQWVFKDDTLHTMRIFYMERGAGAANLQMRFNLTAVKKGTVQLSKELSGVDNTESIEAEFPYQIYYKMSDGIERTLKNHVPPDPDTPPDPLYTDDYVFHMGSINPVKFEKELEIGEKTYQDVFFLKHGEAADVNFPEGTTSYRIVECGVDTEVFESVTVNNDRIEVPGDDKYKDFGIDYASTDERPRVNYVNGVNPEALRTLTIHKTLFKEDGITPITTDPTPFKFRLSLGTEYDSELTQANMYTYHVKDPRGNYCGWDSASQTFESLGVSDYSQLTDDQKKAASFSTSVYGQISKIPANYTMEIRDVLVGTKFKVVEDEVPDGYSFQKYVYNGEHAEQDIGVTDTVTKDSNPNVEVCNIKGWGLRVNKIWSDADYMAKRDPTYFAVFIQESDERITLVEGTVRRLEYSADPQTLYWYFNRLEEGKNIDDYLIREVWLTGYWTVDEDGVVTVSSDNDVHPIDNGGPLTLDGKQKGETQTSTYQYTVQYETGTVEGDSNVRVDTVTNNRPGIELRKTQWDGETQLGGATFTLKRGEEEIGTFTSDDAGLISVAYLSDDVDYILTETSAPQGWYGLQTPLTLRLHNGKPTVTGDSDVSGYYVVDNTVDTPILTIKDRPYTLQAIKKDGDTEQVMAGVTFSLSHLITVDEVTDFVPMPGYESLVTGADGVIPKIDNTLPAGTYLLNETTPEGYTKLSGIVRFTVSDTGSVDVFGTEQEPLPDGVSLKRDEKGDGSFSYTLTINNYRKTSITLKKVDDGNNDLPGAKFKLYKHDGESWADGKEIDLTAVASKEIADLSPGRYRLEETKSPDGYIILTSYVYFDVSFADSGVVVTLTDDEGQRAEYDNASVSGTTITVKNAPGSELPQAGGSGTAMFTLVGSLLIAAGAMLAARRLRSSHRTLAAKP